MENVAILDIMPDEKYQCAQCKQCFAQSQLLDVHGQETKHKAYQCGYEGCSKSYGRRQAHSRHVKTHLGPPSHECPHCEKIYHRSDHAREHETACARAMRKDVREPPALHTNGGTPNHNDIVSDIPVTSSEEQQFQDTQEMSFQMYHAQEYGTIWTGETRMEDVVFSAPGLSENASDQRLGTMLRRVEQTRKRPSSQLSTSEEGHNGLDKRARQISTTICEEGTAIHQYLPLVYELDQHEMHATWASLEIACRTPNDKRSTAERTARTSSHTANRARDSIHSVAEQVQGLRFVIDFAQIISVPTPGEQCCFCGLKQSKDLNIFFQHVVYHFQSGPRPDLECKHCSITFVFLEDFQKHTQYRNSRDGISECEKMLHSGDCESDWVKDAFRTDFVQSLRTWEKLKLYWLYNSVNNLIQARLQSDSKSLKTLPDRLSKATLPHRRFSSQSCTTDFGRADNIDMLRLSEKLATVSLHSARPLSLGFPPALQELNVLVIGNPGGCSQLAIRFTTGMFCNEWEPTIEDTWTKDMKIGDVPVHFNIVDHSGIEEWAPMLLINMKKIHGVLICFRVNSGNTVQEALRIYRLIRKWLGKEQKHEADCPIMFIANLCDLEWEDEAISIWNEASAGQLKDVPLFQVSARDRINVEKPFVAMAEAILEQRRIHTVSVTTKHRFDSAHDRKRRQKLGAMWRNLLSRVEE